MKVNIKTKPVLIISLLCVFLILIIVNIYRTKLFGSLQENFQTDTKPSTDAQSKNSTPDLFEGTYNMSEVTDKGKLNSMFKNLEDAERRSDVIESQQLQREQKMEMRENDKTYKELLEQDKKIHELKELVKYLTVEKKRRDKVNNKCKAKKQGKLNENYNIVKSLNKAGLVKDNSVELDLNISDSKKLQALLKSIQKGKKGALEDTSVRDYKKCSSKGNDYVDIDKIGLEKCHNCSAEKIKKQENYIAKDF